jgi:hypothetical protein
MALGYLLAGQAATDQNFLARVTGYLALAANNVLSEVTSTADHQIRAIFAKRVQANPSAYAVQMAVDVAMQSGPQSASTLGAVTDTQIQVAVDSLFTQFAFSTVLPNS